MIGLSLLYCIFSISTITTFELQILSITLPISSNFLMSLVGWVHGLMSLLLTHNIVKSCFHSNILLFLPSEKKFSNFAHGPLKNASSVLTSSSSKLWGTWLCPTIATLIPRHYERGFCSTINNSFYFCWNRFHGITKSYFHFSGYVTIAHYSCQPL